MICLIISTNNFLSNYMILLQIFLLKFLNLKVAVNALANWKIRDEIIETFVRWFFVEFDRGEALLSLSSSLSLSLHENKVIIEKSRGGRFLWNRNFRFGLDLGQMANFPAFIAAKSFDLWNNYIHQKFLYNLWHILMYQKYMKFKKNI